MTGLTFRRSLLLACSAFLIAGCFGDDPQGLRVAPAAQTTVAFDFFHRPLPEIPLPNDIATRFDATSATGRRVNASIVAPTQYERQLRALIDQLDGWGLQQPINIPFTGPLDIQSILDAHRDANYSLDDDVVYLINVDRDSEEFGRIHHLDIGNGNFPVVVEEVDGYWKNDSRGWTLSLLFEEADEDTNGNGRLDRGEDTDADGLLDVPNYLPGHSPARDDLAGRADALMTFYERETNTLIVKPMLPLRERTTYAVVVTRRLLDADGNPVGSPFTSINHVGQNAALAPLPEVLPDGLSMSDIAFTWTYTTQSLESHIVAVRDGLYGHGVQAHIGEEFPAQIDTLLPLREEGRFNNMVNPYIMWAENWNPVFRLINEQFQGGDADTVPFNQLMQSLEYVDFYAVGRYQSPQLFMREDADGNALPFNDQSWPPDLDMVPAPTRSEDVHFMVAVPRREISDRGDGGPAPTVILSHGYGSSRFEVATFAGYFARHGLAVIAIDGPSHGIGRTTDDEETVDLLLDSFGFAPFVEAVFTDRAWDQNNDGNPDSAADFWSAYLFHTRDVVRQYALDLMQLVRIMRAFDGETRWSVDVNGDGEPDLAGDFDGDGVVDIGGDVIYAMTGGSLGGMMSTVMGGLEPQLDVIAPVVAGGGLADLGIRSQQGGVREAFILPAMGPLYVGTLNEEGALLVETIVTNINDRPDTIPLAIVPDVDVGDTLVAVNLVTDERGCGHVSPAGTVRAPLATDLGDPIEIRLYRNDVLVLGSEECDVMASQSPFKVIDTFEIDTVRFSEPIDAGTELTALMEGLGLRRAHPDFRRFQGLAALITDPGDPAIYAQYHQQQSLYFPGTGESTGVHTLLIPTVGDMNVPVHGVLAIARAAGLLEFLEDNPGHGMPDNQVLIDSYTAEGVHNLDRYIGPDGNGIHISPDDWSGGHPELWPWKPRIAPPLRSHLDQTDPLGGVSGLMWVYGDPRGSHGPKEPGEMIQIARDQCESACAEGEDCDCDEVWVFDHGNFVFDIAGQYAASGGMVFDPDVCHARWDCDDVPPPPPSRRVVDPLPTPVQ